MGKQCRRGKVIMSPGHKWDNSGYYNHTGERRSPHSPCMGTTMEVHPFPAWGHARRQAIAAHTARRRGGKQSASGKVAVPPGRGWACSAHHRYTGHYCASYAVHLTIA